MIGWLIALAAVLLLLFLKVGVRFRWDSGSYLLKIRVGLLRFALSTDKKEKKKKPPKKKKPSAKAEKAAKQEPPTDPKTGKPVKEKKPMSPQLKSWIVALIDCRGELFALIGKVLRSPTLDLLRLQIGVGGGDPEMTYGKICAGLGAGLPVLHRMFRIKKQDIQVSCRYDLSKLEIEAEAEVTIMIYEVFALIGTVLGLLIKIYLTKKRNEKAVRTV